MSIDQLKFIELGLNENLLNAIKKMGYKEPTLIQAKTIPQVLTGKDLLGQAQTGTGKTAAFALPLIQRIINNNDKNKEKSPQVLVLTPTRELAMQVADNFKQFSVNTKYIDTIAIYGGQEYYAQIKALKNGIKIVVGTIGRIIDHINKGNLKLTNLKALVLDEADEMLCMGFLEDVKFILNKITDNCQRLLFSSTIPNEVMKLVNKYLREPHKIQIQKTNLTAKTIYQRFLVVKGLSKLDALDRILETENTKGVIVFVKTKIMTIKISDQLKSRGYLVMAINGNMQQNQREEIIDKIKSLKINILVATDIVARGLDIDHITHVINYDLPQNNEAYIHRIGRTGRAGRKGNAISLIYLKEMRQLKFLEKMINNHLDEMKLPSALEITEKRVQDFKNTILEIINMNNKKLDPFKTVIQEIKDKNDINTEELLAALTLLAQKHKPIFIKDVKKTYNHDYDKNHKQKYVLLKRNKEYKNLLMQNYRVEVGKQDNIKISNIFGAISNETDINSKHIGYIKIFDTFSTVNLPKNLPDNTIEHLKKVWVGGKQLKIKEN